MKLWEKEKVKIRRIKAGDRWEGLDRGREKEVEKGRGASNEGWGGRN